MGRLLSASILVVALLLCLCWAHTAQAEPIDASTRAAARELGREAIKLYRVGKYVDALDRMSRAHDLVQLTTTGLWRARCLEKLGRLVEASEQLRDVKKMTLSGDAKPVHRAAQTDAAKELSAIEARIARISIDLEEGVPADTVVSIDGVELDDVLIGVTRPIDPGRHNIAVAGGGMKAEKAIELSEGETLELPVRMEDRSAGGGLAVGRDSGGFSPAGIVGFVAIGVGVVGLTIGAVFGAMAIGAKEDLEASCPDMGCQPEFHGDIDSFDTKRTVSTAMFIAGGVIAAIGLTLVITDVTTGGSEEPSSATLVITPFGARGTF